MVREMCRQVPAHFLDGVTGIQVTGKTVPHPVREGVFTLGECVPHVLGGPDDEGPTLRSHILLHYGSFLALARTSPDFDWRSEAWETLTHELRHHLEWRARVPALEALDEAVEANYARHDGETIPPLFHLDGEAVAPGVTKVEDDVFLDVAMSSRAWRRAAGTVHGFRWHGRSYGVPLPATLPDVLFLSVQGVEPEPAGDLVLVIRRRPGARDFWHRATIGQARARVTSTAPRR
jgi:hypothetical protein